MSTPVDPLLAELHVFPLTRFQVEVPSDDRKHGVIAAWDTQLQRRVACKCAVDPIAYDGMDSEQLAAVFGMDHADPEKVAKRLHRERRYSVIREARLLATIDHPNVIPVLDVGRMGKRVFAVILPYLEGGTAEREFTGPWQDVLEVALQIGRGLAAVHAGGILHRDIKPSNVLLNGMGRPLIADLGLSCRLDDASAMMERVGTPLYMPPDVYAGGHKDVRDDLYSYCIVVFEMFYGQLPFGTVTDRDLGHVARPRRVGGMPRALHEILVRGLAPRRVDRWPNMKALLHAMERVRQPKRWPLAAAATLAAGIAIGVFVEEGIAKADTCEYVVDELAVEWNDQARTELLGAFGTRKASDGLDDWATRWLEVRAQECAAARDAGQPTEPTPCSVSTRDRFQATVKAFRSPLLRDGLQFASVIAEMPAPEHCIDHPDDADWGYGGLLELADIDIEVDALMRAGSLDLARARQADYMKLALELGSKLGTARATYFRAEIQRLDGQLDPAAEDLEEALQQSVEIGAPGFTAECLLSLAAIAGTRGDMATMNAHALMARELFARYRPERVAELLQVQGLALVSGTDGERERGVELLQRAMEMREEQLRKQIGSREWLSQARESYARGLLAVKRAAEAIELLDLALRVHQEEFGHGTWRTRAILMQKFLALVELQQLDNAEPVELLILNLAREDEAWARYCDDALWLAEVYERAAAFRRAAKVLNYGRDAAVRQGLAGHAAAINQALQDLPSE